MLELIMEALKAVWNWIKKIFLKILNFFNNIVNWFMDPERLKKIQENKDIIAVAIKQNLENGNYNVVNCLFDTNRGEIVDYETDAVIIEAEQLDSETLRAFGNKDMIVLN